MKKYHNCHVLHFATALAASEKLLRRSLPLQMFSFAALSLLHSLLIFAVPNSSPFHGLLFLPNGLHITLHLSSFFLRLGFLAFVLVFNALSCVRIACPCCQDLQEIHVNENVCVKATKGTSEQGLKESQVLIATEHHRSAGLIHMTRQQEGGGTN